MQPVTFLRGLLCLSGSALKPTRCPHPAHLDAIDDHPYSDTPTTSALIPGDVSMMDQGKLWRVLHRAQQTGRVRPRGSKSLWVTEINWPSDPPGPEHISLNRQAAYLSLAYYELWRQDISHVMWFLIQDAPQSLSTLRGAGVYFANGKAKPSAQAARFPFVAIRHGPRDVILWGRSPRAGTVTIDSGNGHGWHPKLRLRTTPGGVFYAVEPLNRRLSYRATAPGATSRGYSPG